MLTKAFARIGQSPFGFMILGAVTTVVVLGTYLAAGQSAAKAPPVAVQRPAAFSSEPEFGPPPDAAGFGHVLVTVSNAFAEQHGDPARLSNPHCVEASRGHYMCAYTVARPHRASECHLVQAEWAKERASSFTVVMSGRVRRCGSVREAVRSLS